MGDESWALDGDESTCSGSGFFLTLRVEEDRLEVWREPALEERERTEERSLSWILSWILLLGERMKVAVLVDERRLTFEDFSSGCEVDFEMDRERVDLLGRSRSWARLLAAETSVSGGVGGREDFL